VGLKGKETMSKPTNESKELRRRLAALEQTVQEQQRDMRNLGWALLGQQKVIEQLATIAGVKLEPFAPPSPGIN
jgi:signal transduction histidine kinase